MNPLPRHLLMGGLRVLLATVLAGLLVRLVLRLERRLHAAVDRWAADPGTSGELERVKLVTPAQVAAALLALLRLLRMAALLSLGYAWLVAVFGSFAWTRPLASRILHFVLDPLTGLAAGLVGYLPNLFFIAVAVAVLRMGLRTIHLVFHGIEQGSLTFHGFPAEWADPTYKIVRALVVALGLILVFPYLPGAGSDAFKAISLFAGALFSLGSTGAVANIVAGAVIVYTRSFRVGDFVVIGETEGVVVERSLLVTQVRTMRNIVVSIPSATVLNSHVQNLTAVAAEGGLMVQSRVTIGYDAPWRQVHSLLLDAARCTEGVLAAPAPFVVQEALNDYYPTYCLSVYTDRPAGVAVFRLRSRLHENIQDAFFAAGVEILSPAFTSVRDGNRTAMPAEYLPASYVAPSWRVARDGGAA